MSCFSRKYDDFSGVGEAYPNSVCNVNHLPYSLIVSNNHVYLVEKQNVKYLFLTLFSLLPNSQTDKSLSRYMYHCTTASLYGVICSCKVSRASVLLTSLIIRDPPVVMMNMPCTTIKARTSYFLRGG